MSGDPSPFRSPSYGCQTCTMYLQLAITLSPLLLVGARRPFHKDSCPHPTNTIVVWQPPDNHAGMSFGADSHARSDLQRRTENRHRTPASALASSHQESQQPELTYQSSPSAQVGGRQGGAALTARRSAAARMENCMSYDGEFCSIRQALWMAALADIQKFFVHDRFGVVCRLLCRASQKVPVSGCCSLNRLNGLRIKWSAASVAICETALLDAVSLPSRLFFSLS